MILTEQLMEKTKKDILVPYLKKQIADLSLIIRQIEDNDPCEEAMILEYFYQKGKDDKRLLRSIFN